VKRPGETAVVQPISSKFELDIGPGLWVKEMLLNSIILSILGYIRCRPLSGCLDVRGEEDKGGGELGNLIP